MGLDMFLGENIYVGANYSHRGITGNITVYEPTRDGGVKRIDKGLKNLSYLNYTKAYWRKANQIHKWFVDNVQDGVDNCGTYGVGAEQLRELVDICKKVCAVLDKYSEHKKGGIYVLDDMSEDDVAVLELLPPASGFFFGSTNIDEWYYDDLVSTIEQLTDISDDSEYEYRASW